MLVRHSIFSKLLAFGLGLIFFNLSFMMLEAKLIGLEKKNKALYEKMIRFMAGGGCEEEKDSSESTHGFGQNEAKLTLCFALAGFSNQLLAKENLYLQRSSRLAQSVYLEITTPPPRHSA